MTIVDGDWNEPNTDIIRVQQYITLYTKDFGGHTSDVKTIALVHKSKEALDSYLISMGQYLKYIRVFKVEEMVKELKVVLH